MAGKTVNSLDHKNIAIDDLRATLAALISCRKKAPPPNKNVYNIKGRTHLLLIALYTSLPSKPFLH